MVAPYYEHDGITIYHGDCRDVLPHVSAHVMVTDPPYGIGYSSGAGSEVWGDGAVAGDEDTALRDAVLELWSPRPALVFGSWRRPHPAGARMKLIWDTKGALGMGALDLPWKPAHQEIYVLGKGFEGHRGNDVIRCAPVQSMAKNGRVHPMQKPVSLLRALINKCPSGTVIDPFAGSGSTLVAAKQAGRRAIGTEIEERYCEIAAKRLSQGVLGFSEVPA